MKKPGLFTRQELALLFLLSAVQFSHIVDFVIMMPLGPQLMKFFTVGPREFGLLVSSYTFAAGVSGILASFFVDRFDRKSCLIFFSLGFASGTLACAWAPTYEALVIARSAAGAFGGVLGSLVLSIISDRFDYARRGAAMGILMGSFSLASIIGVPLGLMLANDMSWHTPFVFIGSWSLLLSAVAFFAIPPMRAHLTGPGSHHSPTASLAHVLNTPNQLRALLFMVCLVLGQFTVITFLSPSYVANAGLAQSELPLMYLTGGICSLFATPLIGRMADRFGKHVVFRASAFLSIPGILAITHMVPLPVFTLLLVSCLFFITMSGRMVPAMTIVTATATPQYRGSFLSLSSSVQQFSMALASFIAGVLIVQDSEGHLLNYPLVGYMAIGFTLIAMTLSYRITTEGDKKPSAPVLKAH